MQEAASTLALTVMQSDRYSNSKTSVTFCKWCGDEYPLVSSRAMDVQMFCRRRCETEARFWLYEVLNTTSNS